MNNDYASSGGSSGGASKTQIYGFLGLAIGIGWIYYNIHTNMKQNKRILALERLLAVGGNSGKANYANFVKQPDSSGVTYGAAPGSVSEFDVNSVDTGIHEPNIVIMRRGGKMFVESRV